MENPATRPADELNDFTTLIKEEPGTWVRIRNGYLVQPSFQAAEDETCFDCFSYPGHRWELNGRSIRSRDFDMMKIERP